MDSARSNVAGCNSQPPLNGTNTARQDQASSQRSAGVRGGNGSVGVLPSSQELPAPPPSSADAPFDDFVRPMPPGSGSRRGRGRGRGRGVGRGGRAPQPGPSRPRLPQDGGASVLQPPYSMPRSSQGRGGTRGRTSQRPYHVPQASQDASGGTSQSSQAMCGPNATMPSRSGAMGHESITRDATPSGTSLGLPQLIGSGPVPVPKPRPKAVGSGSSRRSDASVPGFGGGHPSQPQPRQRIGHEVNLDDPPPMDDLEFVSTMDFEPPPPPPEPEDVDMDEGAGSEAASSRSAVSLLGSPDVAGGGSPDVAGGGSPDVAGGGSPDGVGGGSPAVPAAQAVQPPAVAADYFKSRLNGICLFTSTLVSENFEAVQEDGRPDNIRRFSADYADNEGNLRGRLRVTFQFEEEEEGDNDTFWNLSRAIQLVNGRLPQSILHGTEPEQPLPDVPAAAIKEFKLPPHVLNGGRYECTKCYNTFPSEEELRTHKQLLRFERYSCKICRLQFNTIQSMRVHNARHNRETRRAAQMAAAAKKRFDRASTRRGAQIAHRSPGEVTKEAVKRARLRALARAEKAGGEIYRCGSCNEVQFSRHACAAHQEKHPEPYLPYSCHWCPAAFKTEEGRTVHEECHKPSNSMCLVCQKYFRYSGDCTLHAVTKHGATPGTMVAEPSVMLATLRRLEEEHERAFRAPVGQAQDAAAAAAAAASGASAASGGGAVPSQGIPAASPGGSVSTYGSHGEFGFEPMEEEEEEEEEEEDDDGQGITEE